MKRTKWILAIVVIIGLCVMAGAAMADGSISPEAPNGTTATTQPELVITRPVGDTGRTAQNPAPMCSEFTAEIFVPGAKSIFFYVNDGIEQDDVGEEEEGAYYGRLTDATTVITAEAVFEDGSKATYGPVTLYAAGTALDSYATALENSIPATVTAGEDWGMTMARPAGVDAEVQIEYAARLIDLDNEDNWIQITPNGNSCGWLYGDMELSVSGQKMVSGHTYEMQLEIYAEGYQPVRVTKKITAVSAEKSVDCDPIILSARILHFDGTEDEPVQPGAVLPLHQPVMFSFTDPDATMVRFWKGEEFAYLTKWDANDDGVYEVDWDYWRTGEVQVYAQACYDSIPEDSDLWWHPEALDWEPVTTAELFSLTLITDGDAEDTTVRFNGQAEIGTIMQGEWLTATVTGSKNYSICAASIYQYEGQRIRVDMDYDEGLQKWSCKIPTAMLEPGYYHIVVFAEAVGKENCSKHSSFTVTENPEAQAGDAFLLTTTAQKGNDGSYTVEAFEDVEICFWAPDWDGHEKYYEYFDGREWQEERGAFGRKEISLEPGEQTITARVHYIIEETNQEDGEGLERSLRFNATATGSIGLDIDWAYDLNKVNLEQTEGWLPMFQISLPEGKEAKWWEISAKRITGNGEEEILGCYSERWMPIHTAGPYAVRQDEVNIKAGDRVHVRVEINAQGCQPFRAEGEMVFHDGTDPQIRLTVDGEDEELDIPAKTYTTAEITISEKDGKRPTALRYWNAPNHEWMDVYDYQPGETRVRLRQQFDSGDWPMFVQGRYEDGWSEQVSNVVTLHVTATETAKRAAYTVTPTAVDRGGLVTVNVTGTIPPEQGKTEKDPQFFSINFRNGQENEYGVFLEATIPFSVQIPTSRLHAGEWSICVDTSAANCEWRVVEYNEGQAITINEPAANTVTLDIPETIYAHREFPVSAYAKGAMQMVIRYVDENGDETVDEYMGEYAYEDRQWLEEGTYRIQAQAVYYQPGEGTMSSIMSEAVTRVVGYEGNVEIELNGPENGVFSAAEGLSFTVSGLEQEHGAEWRVEVRGNDNCLISKWRDGDEGPVTADGVTSFAVPQGINAGEVYNIHAELWGQPGWRGDSKNSQAMAITATQGVTLSVNGKSACEIMRPQSVEVTVAGLPANATYVELFREWGKKEHAKVNPQTHKATMIFTPGSKGNYTYWARYTTQQIEVNENELWMYNWDSVEWAGGTNAARLTVTAPYGRISAPEFTITSGTTVMRGEFFTVEIGQLKTLEDNEKEWYIGSIEPAEGVNGPRGRDCQWDEETKTIWIPTAQIEAGSYSLRVYVDAIGYEGYEILTPVTITEPAAGQISASVNGNSDTGTAISAVTQEEVRWSVYAPGAAMISATMKRGQYDDMPIRSPECEGEYAEGSLYTWGTTGTGYVTITVEYPSGSAVTKEWTVNVSAPKGNLAQPKVKGGVLYRGTDTQITVVPDGNTEGFNVEAWIPSAEGPLFSEYDHRGGEPISIPLTAEQIGNAPEIDIHVYSWSKGWVASQCHVIIMVADPQKVMRLPAFLTTIEAEAFAGIAAEAVIIPEGVTRIEENTFANCPDLKAVVIPDSVTYIDPSALENRWGMTIYGSSETAKRFAEDKYCGFVEIE